jgi:hypothetical protein
LLILLNVVAAQAAPIMISKNDANTGIDGASQALLAAYRSILAAESAGADVTALTGRLNEALDLLTRARESYGSGDYISASDCASRSKLLSDGVVLEAERLVADAKGMSQIRTVIFFVGVPLVLVLLVAGGYYGFRIMRKRSVEGIMKKRVRILKEEKED